MKTFNLTGIIALTISIIAIVLIFTLPQKKDKFGVVDLQQVFGEFSYTKEIQIEIDAEFSKRLNYVDSLEYQLKNTELKIMNSSSQALIEEHNILKRQWELEQYALDNDYARRITDANEKIWAQLNQYVRDFAIENNYSILLGASGDGKIMHADESLDVTLEVIEFVNNKYSGL